MANQIGVMNPTKNKTRVLFVDEGSYTHKQAVKQSGGWILADKSQADKETQKKKVVESAEDETPLTPAPSNEGENPEAEGEGKEELKETPQAPAPEQKPKAGSKKNQTKEGK